MIKMIIDSNITHLYEKYIPKAKKKIRIVALFQIFANLFHGRQLDSHICSWAQSVFICFSVGVCEENLASCRRLVGKGENILIAFS